MSLCWTLDEIERAARSGSAGGDPAHLAECERCRAELERARRDGDLLAELRRSARDAPRAGGTGEIPGYRLVSEIRRGGQGVVYRAEQVATRRAVALKLISSIGAGDARARRRFEREIELVSRLDHPHLVTVFDSGIAGDAPWYAMELVDGVPLDEWVRAERPDARRIVELFRRIASAVAHAHQRGVIHRDLKPANVLVDASGAPRILDFGTAFAAADETGRMRVTAPGEFLGTLAYAAPEQLRGATNEIDTRTDVYALGVALYEALTGRLPHDRAESLAQIVERVTTLAPQPPSAFARGIDRELDAIVLKALATRAAERYDSAEALARDLGRYLAGEPLEARRHSFAYVLGKHVARRRKALIAAAAVLAIAGALGVAWLREFQRAEGQREQAKIVRSVVKDLLGAAAPQRMGGDARLLDVYDHVARDLDRALEKAPDVQAEVELTIGDTYRRLLRAPEAEPHLRKALQRFREVDGPRELEVARAGNVLALALADLNRPEAIPVAEAALAIRERELDGASDALAESRRTLAIAILQQFRDQDVERASDLLDRSIAALHSAHGDDDPEVAESKIWRARSEARADPEVIERLLSEAVATFARHAPEDPRAIEASTAYASFLQEHGRFDEARAQLDRSAELTHKLFGEALATDLLRRFARLEFARGDAASAEQLSRQAVARELRRWAEQRPEDRARLRSLAQRIDSPGSPSAAPPYADAFEELRRIQGDGMFELAQWMNGIAMTLRAQGRGAESVPLLLEALQIRCRAMGADCPVRQRTIELLASELVDERRAGEAVALLEESVETYRRLGDAASPEAQRVGQLLESCKRQLTDGSAPANR